jgi:hypothetical protein
MPYVIVPKDEEFCVHKENPDGSPGEVIACHATRDAADAQRRALYANEDGAESESVPFGFIDMRIVEAEAQTGRAWDVTIMGPTPKQPLVTLNGRELIMSANGRFYAVEGLRQSVPLWEGVKVYDNHLTDDEFRRKAGMRSFLSEGVGVLTNPYFDESRKSLCARLNVVDPRAAEKFLGTLRAGVLQHIGLSADSQPIPGRSVIYEGREWPVMEGFARVASVDVVSEPAAGGAFNRLLETRQPNPQEEQMDEELKTFVVQAVADALAAKQAEEAKAAEAKAEADAKEAAEKAAAEAKAKADAEDAEKDKDKTEALEQKVALLESSQMLDKRLAEARLPAHLDGMIRGLFSGKVIKAEELEEAVKRAKEAQAVEDPSGNPKGAGDASVRMGMNERDKRELAFLQWMAGARFRGLESAQDVTVQERMPEAFTAWVKDGRPKYAPIRRLPEFIYEMYGGDPFLNPRVAEAQTTSDLTSIIKNTVNLMLAADYSVRDRWWEPLVITEEVDSIDDATLVRVYGLNALPVVAEGAPYTELNTADEEETASHIKKGGYIGVTMEALMSDKLGFLRSLPQRLSTSWYNTLSDLNSAVFTTNNAAGPVLGTTGALFNSTAVTSAGGHANLGSAALSYAAWDAVVTAMAKQTDQPLGAGRRLLIRPRYLLVPVDLRATATQIRNSEMLPGSQNNDINPYYQGFEIVQVPNWTDTNNWAALADPQQFPVIYNIFPRGYRVPQVFEASDQSSGAMFTQDELRFKVRMLTYRFSSTYDCAPVVDFRPVYQSIVS